ncbi:MAG: XRE family transcriptional regulator [Erysipelotrichia bacterium]|nr:XRE family transcriptional regulator [Erysipelotrichia bacterium]
MKKQNFYVYLGKCIQKIRYNKYSQNELSKDICSKYTLSRIENGKMPSDIKIIHKLLTRLHYHYEDVVDLTILSSILKHLLAEMEYNNPKEIIADIHKIEQILKRNKHNILFYDHQILYSYLYTHYIAKQPIIRQAYDTNTLIFHNDAFYTIFVSIISENLLIFGKIKSFNLFFEQLAIKNGNIILDFFYMLYLQIHAQTLEVNDIFNYHKEDLKKDGKTYQLIRYLSVLALGYIEYEPEKAMAHFNKISAVHNKSMRKNHYYFIAILGEATIYIHQKDYKKAYTCIDECIMQYPRLILYAIPYIIFLSFRINKKVDDKYLHYGYNELCDACIDYYHFHSNQYTGTKHVQYMIKTFPHLLKEYRINDPFITILRKEELAQVDRGHCYKSGVRFYKKLKENCKEVIPL